jgi:hypothetical protein
VARKGLKPGQVPDWRPGADFWKPLPDGREVTIYPLLHDKARLCVGPLADPNGYDIAYRYPNLTEAVAAAESWDSEADEHPAGYEEIEFGRGVIPHQGAAAVHSGALQVGTKLEMNDQFRNGFNISQHRAFADRSELFICEGITEDGYLVNIEAVRREGDPVGAGGCAIVTIKSVTMNLVTR